MENMVLVLSPKLMVMIKVHVVETNQNFPNILSIDCY